MEIKYAWSSEIKGDFESWSLKPWHLRGLQVYRTLAEIPHDAVLVASHYAPWWPGLREWIAAGRPWIEIEYGYWGKDEKRRQTRRVTYCGHHNTHMAPRPHNRSRLFSEPMIEPWRNKDTGKYVLVAMPINELLLERTGQDLASWQISIEAEIRKYWSGEIAWRAKSGSRRTRFQNFKAQLVGAHAVVGERTMACVESSLLGVPGYTIDNSIATLLTGGIENLANTQYPDREDWWDHVCWSQFHNTEFATDVPARLVEQYQIYR